MQLFKIIFCKHFSLRIHSTLEKKLWCIFWKLLHHLTFPPSTCWRKIDATACANQRIFLQKVGASGQPSYSFLGFQWDKTSKLKCWFSRKSGDFYQETFVSLKTDLFRNPWKVLEYECCTETRDYLQLKRHMMWVVFIFFKNRKLNIQIFSLKFPFSSSSKFNCKFGHDSFPQPARF